MSNFVAIEPQLKLFQRLLPDLAKIGFIYNPGEANSVVLSERIKLAAASLGIEVVTSVATNTADIPTATMSIVDSVDALFISNDNTALSAFQAIVNIADKRDVPVFASDHVLVGQGAVAALGPCQYELGRQTGQMVLALLQGRQIDTIAPQGPQMVQTKVDWERATKMQLADLGALRQELAA